MKSINRGFGSDVELDTFVHKFTKDIIEEKSLDSQGSGQRPGLMRSGQTCQGGFMLRHEEFRHLGVSLV